MTPEAQRIAIAEACGWRHVYTGLMADGQVDDRYVVGDRYASVKDIPDYLNDLNACHEMEKVLVGIGKLSAYRDLLTLEHGYDAMFCTAAQRAEAFLRTTGRWVGA